MTLQITFLEDRSFMMLFKLFSDDITGLPPVRFVFWKKSGAVGSVSSTLYQSTNSPWHSGSDGSRSVALKNI